MLTRQKVRSRVALWQRRLYLEHWHIACRFSPKEGHTAHCDVDEKRSAFDIDYLELELYFDLHRKDEGGDLYIRPDNLDAYIIHELSSHTALWPLGAFAEAIATTKRERKLLTRAEEQTAVMWERILLHAFGLAKQDAA